MVLRDQCRYFKAFFVSAVHQVNGDANIYAFFMTIPINLSAVHVNSRRLEGTGLVRPKRVPPPLVRTEPGIRNASVEAYLDEFATWNPLGESFSNLHHVVTRPRISGCSPIPRPPPCEAREVEQILTVYENCGSHKGNTRPRHEACCSRQWTGRNYSRHYCATTAGYRRNLHTCLPIINTRSQSCP